MLLSTYLFVYDQMHSRRGDWLNIPHHSLTVSGQCIKLILRSNPNMMLLFTLRKVLAVYLFTLFVTITFACLCYVVTIFTILLWIFTVFLPHFEMFIVAQSAYYVNVPSHLLLLRCYTVCFNFQFISVETVCCNLFIYLLYIVLDIYLDPVPTNQPTRSCWWAATFKMLSRNPRCSSNVELLWKPKLV